MAFAQYSIKYIAPCIDKVLNIFKILGSNNNIVQYFLSYYYRTVTGSTLAQDSHGERPLYRLFTSVHFLGKKSEQTKTHHYDW